MKLHYALGISTERALELQEICASIMEVPEPVSDADFILALEREEMSQRERLFCCITVAKNVYKKHSPSALTLVVDNEETGECGTEIKQEVSVPQPAPAAAQDSDRRFEIPEAEKTWHGVGD